MPSSRRLGRGAAAALGALMLTACASMQVSSYVVRGADFTQYRTYAWAPAEAWSTGDPRLDNNPFFDERVQTAVDAQLAGRGFEKATSGTPDLLIHYHASVTQRIDVNRIDREYGYCDGECRADVYDAGTLLLDLVDARANTLVWRGWAEDSLDGVIDNQDWMEAKIDKAVRRILAQLPRTLRPV